MSSDLKSFLEGLDSLAQDCESRKGQACSLKELEELRIEFLGRKGKLAQIMGQLGVLDNSEKPAAGKKANEVKQLITGLIDGWEAELNAAESNQALSRFDPSMPGRKPWAGSLHPVTLVMDEVCSVLNGLGFEFAAGPEVENDWHNFEALNIPPEHPARDMQDTLYVSDNIVLRTHTSGMQIRSMLKQKPPVAVIAPGKVYRRDSDLTHTPMFHQIEGLLVDKKVSMGDLRGTLTAFVRQVFGAKTEVRFRPSFFPFTEPSAEVDISCVLCGGKGEKDGSTCRVCKGTGWVEILGCGMVDPNVFKAVGYDPEVYTGFAFGTGIERIAMLKYGIGDLRMFFENDVRFLEQFA
ncbi:phenylalanine--tRNA ligase subunit alpha [Pseudodesulfovibrio sp. S3]|uniref:phenylalanine--tRNA ligase subunit alpha n=1 Tax=unclassified Pseudodesulfovibrio TaxID=2661612 RepID=UPI000FEBDAC1|nr:phenylalanine--tRNA ligase subunit alpha [Pseudodesulfovibrio sp. S3]RWU02321.1 phenylalanine--tRNA ligase subunit alpha [Pseudodesulfovibrio sp. S3]